MPSFAARARRFGPVQALFVLGVRVLPSEIAAKFEVGQDSAFLEGNFALRKSRQSCNIAFDNFLAVQIVQHNRNAIQNVFLAFREGRTWRRVERLVTLTPSSSSLM